MNAIHASTSVSPPRLGVTAVMLPELDFPEQIALCRELGVTHYTFRPRLIAEKDRTQPYSNWGNHKFDLTPARLLREASALRQTLQEAGMIPFGTVPNVQTNSAPEEVLTHLQGAAAAGAGRVRINPRNYPAAYFDYPALLRQVLADYRRLVALAKPMGLKIVMETHAGSLAADPALAWAICREFDPSEVGVIFDLPNFAREGNLTPHLAVSVIGPWIDHCHVGAARRVATGQDSAGFRKVSTEFCALEEGDLSLPAWLTALKQAGIHVPWVMEDYSPRATGAQRLRESVAAFHKAWNATG